MDSQDRRKVFLTNALALFVAVYTLIVALNDIFNVGYYLAGYRRLAVFGFMLLIPFLNSKKLFALSKSIFLTVPMLVQFGVPVLIGDVTESQFIWFQYVAAIFCSVPFLLFNQENEKTLITMFFILYLFITLFIDKALLHAMDGVLPDVFSNYVSDFSRYNSPLCLSRSFQVLP